MRSQARKADNFQGRRYAVTSTLPEKNGVMFNIIFDLARRMAHYPDGIIVEQMETPFKTYLEVERRISERVGHPVQLLFTQGEATVWVKL